jgi:hypothetical protein
MFAWSGYIESYDLVSGIGTQGRRAWFVLHPFKDQADEVSLIEVHFGSFEVAPGAAFGGARPLPGGGKQIVVELPWDGFPTFWRALDKECLLSFFGPEDAITSYGTIVYKRSEEDTDQDRRERIDAMRQRLEETNGAY